MLKPSEFMRRREQADFSERTKLQIVLARMPGLRLIAITRKPKQLYRERNSMGRIGNNIVEPVGRTPSVRVNKVTEGAPAPVLLKREFFDPLGSVKDRIGMSMIEDAEK